MDLIDKEWHPITPFLSKKLANGERTEPGELLMRQHRPWSLGWHYRRPTMEEIRDYERRHAISF